MQLGVTTNNWIIERWEKSSMGNETEQPGHSGADVNFRDCFLCIATIVSHCSKCACKHTLYDCSNLGVEVTLSIMTIQSNVGLDYLTCSPI